MLNDKNFPFSLTFWRGIFRLYTNSSCSRPQVKTLCSTIHEGNHVQPYTHLHTYMVRICWNFNADSVLDRQGAFIGKYGRSSDTFCNILSIDIFPKDLQILTYENKIQTRSSVLCSSAVTPMSSRELRSWRTAFKFQYKHVQEIRKLESFQRAELHCHHFLSKTWLKRSVSNFNNAARWRHLQLYNPLRHTRSLD